MSSAPKHKRFAFYTGTCELWTVVAPEERLYSERRVSSRVVTNNVNHLQQIVGFDLVISKKLSFREVAAVLSCSRQPIRSIIGGIT